MIAKRIFIAGAVLLPLLVSAGCEGDFAQIQGAGTRLKVDLVPPAGEDLATLTGSHLHPLALSIGQSLPFKIRVTALDANGGTDTSFNGYVSINAKPGSIERIDGSDASGRNLKLTNGVSPDTTVGLVNPYGTTFILADDLGYEPVDPLSDPRPACADGLDNDGDGKIDYPADEGCASSNDNTETGGTYSQGASDPIFYSLPRIADVRGLACDSTNTTCTGNGKTPYPKSAISLDTGYHLKDDGSRAYDFDMVVTRISSDGFYVGDPKDKRGGFNGLFAFNFNSPPGMRVCDRIKTLSGTASEFFGFTQLSYPTWTLEQWDPEKRPCLVPDPRVLTPVDIPTNDNPNGSLLPLTGAFVRAITNSSLEVKVTPKFGPEFPQQTGNTFTITENATNCDLNKDGSIDFTAGVPEQLCSDACTNDPECTEYSNFASRSSFRLTITDTQTGTKAPIQADATTSALFKPLEMRGKVLKAFSGILTYFSGGSQYTIEARCADDIVTDVNAKPLPSDKACVYPRTVFEDQSQ
jgi:hypothetical protein